MIKLKITLLSILVFMVNNIIAQNGMQLAEYLDLKPTNQADARYYYGNDQQTQFADLYIPATAQTPYPVVALIHGGCWDARYKGLTQMGAMADSLLAAGFAVWNIEYRCVNQPGGGYPGTYQDIRNALLKLQEIAPSNHLDSDNIVVVGHSAGGHLAIWSAQSNAIEPPSILHSSQQVKVKSAIGLGSILDLNLAEEACPSLQKVGGVDLLIQQNQFDRPEPLTDISPIAMKSTHVPITLIHGTDDEIAPPRYALDYLSKISQDDRATLYTIILVPHATHYDEISTTSSVWTNLLNEIQKAVDRKSAF